jgi:hypothetical protein
LILPLSLNAVSVISGLTLLSLLVHTWHQSAFFFTLTLFLKYLLGSTGGLAGDGGSNLLKNPGIPGGGLCATPWVNPFLQKKHLLQAQGTNSVFLI